MTLKVATLEDVKTYPELNLVEGQEFEVPTLEPLNTLDEEDDPPPTGGEGGTNPPHKPPTNP